MNKTDNDDFISRQRRSQSFYENLTNTNEKDIDKLKKRDDENYENMNKIYEQRKSLYMRKKGSNIKKYIKYNLKKSKSKEEFYEKNKIYLAQNKIKNFNEFMNLVNEIEKEEREEKEKEEKEKKEKEEKERKEKEEKERKEKEEREKKEKEEKERQEKEKQEKLRVKRENLKLKIKIYNSTCFSINSNIKKIFNIEHINDFNQYSNMIKKYKNSNLVTITDIYDFNLPKTNNYLNTLQNCKKTNEYNFISDKNEYLKYKSKFYIIDKNIHYEIISKYKLKYNESELIQSSNEVNINYDKQRNKIDKLSENGLPINDLRIIEKKISKNISNEDKVKKIMALIENESIIKKIIREKKIPLNYIFCVNCYECFNSNEINNHNEHFVLKIDDFKNDEDELDYDGSLNIIYENLKKLQEKIIKYGNKNIIKYYGKLLYDLYDIIINNNSYEELNLSIININENFAKEEESGTFSEIFRDLFLLFCQRISQLTYLKAKELSFSELDEENDNNEFEIDFNEFDIDKIGETIKDKKKLNAEI